MDFASFIYGLVDPVEPKHIRYVGMSIKSEKRPLDHSKNAKKSIKHSHLLHWIRSLHSDGRDYVVIKLEILNSFTSRKFAVFVESCYIKSLRSIGHRLTNVTDGGIGGMDGPASPEFKAKVGAITRRLWQDPNYRAKMKIARTGLKRSEKSCSNMSKAQKGRFVSEETKNKIAQTLTGRKATVETRIKQSIGISTSKRSTAARTRASLKQKEVWNSRKSSDANWRLLRKSEV